jgi:hypothetical protein
VGERFNLQSANWISYVLDPRNQIPDIVDRDLARDTLSVFLGNLIDGLYFSGNQHPGVVETALRMRDTVRKRQSGRIDDVVMTLRDIFSGREWTAVLIPSGMDESCPADRLLTSKGFLAGLSRVLRTDPHLVLHVNDPPQRDFAITDIYPPFQAALSKTARWPGVLLWRRSDEPLFLPIPKDKAEDAIHWIFSRMDDFADMPRYLLAHHYLAAFPSCAIRKGSRLTFLHLSDTHIGSRKSVERIIRVKDLLRDYVDKNRDDSSVVFLVSGDIMQTPDEANVICANDFYQYLSDLNPRGQEPIFVLGNHDVRRKGILRNRVDSPPLAHAFHTRIEWIRDYPVGIVCLNSADRGMMARGKITGEQYHIVADRLAHASDGNPNPFLISMLHHHPLQLHLVDPEMRRFHRKALGESFRKFIGSAYEHMDGLVDSRVFIRFCDSLGVKAILHGHKHIPVAGRIPDNLLTNGPILIFGCGSTVGKNTYAYKKLFNVDYEISMNEIVFDFHSKLLSGRLMVETRYDKGLATMKTRHGFVSRSVLGP